MIVRWLTVALPLMLLTAVPNAEAEDSLSALNAVCRKQIDAHSEDADAICRRVTFNLSKLAPGSPEHIQSIINLGDIRLLDKHYIDAAPFYTTALALSDKRDKNSLATAKILETLAFTKLSYAKYDDARGYAERALAIRDRLGIGHGVEASVTRVMLGDLLAVLTDFPLAESTLKQARDDLAAAGPGARMEYLNAQKHLSDLYELQHRYELAYDAFTRLLSIAAAEPPIVAMVGRAHEELGWICSELHRDDEAHMHYSKALEILKEIGGDPSVVASIELRLQKLGPATPGN